MTGLPGAVKTFHRNVFTGSHDREHWVAVKRLMVCSVSDLASLA